MMFSERKGSEDSASCSGFSASLQGCVAALTQRQLFAEIVAKFLAAELCFHLANLAGNRALIILN
jgi:hypothetical protein